MLLSRAHVGHSGSPTDHQKFDTASGEASRKLRLGRVLRGPSRVSVAGIIEEIRLLLKGGRTDSHTLAR